MRYIRSIIFEIVWTIFGAISVHVIVVVLWVAVVIMIVPCRGFTVPTIRISSSGMSERGYV